MTPEERRKFQEEWTQKLFDGGWICASWPTEYGGKGLSTMESVVLNEEFARAGAPLRADFFGDTLVGPTILQWGSEEQKKEFLPKILSGQISWCQGFSEPDAGSDLAGLKTRAELDGDEWVINGQKIWTTQAQYADYIFLLARTDPQAPKHAGISYLLVPMKQDGIEVRPIVQPDGSAEFNEVFFSNAHCPKDNVVGGLNNGWKVAMTTLGFERGSSATTSHRRFEKELDAIIDKARDNGRIDDPAVRQALMKQWSKIQIMRINGLSDPDRRSEGQQGHRRRRARRDEQDVLVRDAPRHDEPGDGHPRSVRADPDGQGNRGRRLRPRLRPAPRARRLSGDDHAGVVLLLPLRDHLGWHGGDPAQHRRRASARTAEGAQAVVNERAVGLPKEPKPD